MQCIFLGTSGALTSEKRHNTSLFLCPKNRPASGGQGLLVDCNGACIPPLSAAGIAFEDIEHIFLTHRHIDHIGALGNFMQQVWLKACLLRTESEKRTVPLHFYANKETIETVDALFKALSIYDGHPGLFDIVFHELTPEGGTFEINGTTYRYHPNAHTIPCYGLSLNHNGRTLLYSGDTEIHEPLYKGLRGGDILVHECNSLGKTPVRGHTNWGELESLLERLPEITLYLVHLPLITDQEEVRFAERLRERYGNRVMLGKDGQVLTLP